ncbi:MAG: hypothetical protein H6708_28195 [Kofleriaceae bacterium]|nr:hypothetical protein [Myxococcales bacterium]MCB9564283.1 hypothetical protein [Kofleriaceae bacterium]
MRSLAYLLATLATVAACGNDPSPIGGDDTVTADAAPATIDAPSDACGGCPDGTTCGTANDVPVCRTATGIPRFEHVFVILMENTSWDTLAQTDNTPFLHGLFASGAVSSDYHGVEHPSLPNYVALVGGGTGGIACDCNPTGDACTALSCNTVVHNCGCPQDGEHLGDQLDAAGVSWRAYAEDMGTPCNLTSSGDYAVRHVPFLYFQSLQDDATRCADRVVDYDLEFPDDLAATPRRFNFIAPNLVSDMHDPFPAGAQNYANGDAWLDAEVTRIMMSSAYQDRGLLVIVWDEDDLSGVLAPDDPIPMILLSPLAKHDGYVSDVHADHYDLLATFEDGLGLPRLGAAADATPLADFFPAQ